MRMRWWLLDMLKYLAPGTTVMTVAPWVPPLFYELATSGSSSPNTALMPSLVMALCTGAAIEMPMMAKMSVMSTMMARDCIGDSRVVESDVGLVTIFWTAKVYPIYMSMSQDFLPLMMRI
jgi:hypothetical protein